jgi:hypothetical protein
VAIVIPAIGPWLLRWTFSASSVWITLVRFCFLITLLFIGKEFISAYTRKQRLQILRQDVIRIVNISVINLDAFDKSSGAAITLIQEVEAVSRGYHLNNVVPPITMLDEKTTSSIDRRCLRLRRLLRTSHEELIPLIIRHCRCLEELVKPEDYERQLEVHEVADPDIQEAFSGAVISEIEDQESLRALRTMHLRFSILRRVCLCHLISL